MIAPWRWHGNSRRVMSVCAAAERSLTPRGRGCCSPSRPVSAERCSLPLGAASNAGGVATVHTHRSLEQIADSNRWTRIAVVDKLAISSALLALTLCAPHWSVVLAIAALASLAALAWARVPAHAWLRALMAPAIGAATSVLPLLWMDHGIARALPVGTRMLGAASALMLLVLTTPLGELLGAANRWRAARPFVELAFFACRFVQVLRHCAASMNTAWYCRGGRGRWSQIHFALLGASALFARSLERGQRMESALALRAGRADLLLWTPCHAGSAPLRAAAACLWIALAAEVAWR